MASIFNTAKDLKFWHNLEDDLSNLPSPIYEENLHYKGKKALKAAKIKLFPYQLVVKNQAKPFSKFSDLSFRTLFPFYEQNSTQNKYGFSIDSKDFFVFDKTELENWISCLSRYCILTDIDSDFIKIKQIGKGSTSTVYLAQSLENSLSYAIKSIDKHRLNSSIVYLYNLCCEISLLQDMDYNNIVKLLLVYESESSVDLVLEYLPSGSLRKRLKTSGKINENSCKTFMKNLLLTLDYLHSRNIVHRDLKLENIILTSQLGLDFKIIDFGLAFEGDGLGFKWGTTGYLAPEIIKGEKYDFKIDVFSSGVILYCLLTGRHPFTGRTREKTLKKNIEAKFKLDKNISKDAKLVLEAMLQPNPVNRKSATELLSMSWFSDEKRLISTFNTSQFS